MLRALRGRRETRTDRRRSENLWMDELGILVGVLSAINSPSVN